jgi:hypothetical protein
MLQVEATGIKKKRKKTSVLVRQDSISKGEGRYEVDSRAESSE